MAWDDGREKLNELTEHNKTCHPDEVIYEWHEWSTTDGITWGNVDDKGNSVIYDPSGNDIILGKISDESDLESIDEWYAEHFEDIVKKYGGKVIAVVDEEIVAVENTEKQADKAARNSYPDKIPFVTYVPRAEEIECVSYAL